VRTVVRDSLPPEIKSSLTYCWKEGVVAQVMIGIFDYYLTPYALSLGANTQQIGWLVAIPNVLTSVIQLFAVQAVYWAGTRHRMLVYGVGTQAVLLIPVALLPFLPVPGKIFLLIALISIYRLLASLIGPAWGSLVSDYLPEGQRGQYFGWRSRVVAIAGIVGIAFWGILLYLVRKVSPDLGFVILFSGAVIFRFISFYFISKMADVPVHPEPGSEFTFWMFLRRFRESNFVKFIFYVAGITFATQLSAPYFSVHMLESLRFNYLEYTAVSLASALAGLIAFPIWGRHCDLTGTARVLKSTSLMIPVIPLLWMFARSPVHLILVEMFSGFVWSGFILATTNFIYDAVSPAKRVRCLAYYSLINGVAAFLGAGLGGLLAERLPPLFGYPLVTLFLISAIFRFTVNFFLSHRFEEVRAGTERVSSAQLFLSVMGVRPLAGRAEEPEVYPSIRPPRKKFDHS
jgi:MFS family permease